MICLKSNHDSESPEAGALSIRHLTSLMFRRKLIKFVAILTSNKSFELSVLNTKILSQHDDKASMRAKHFFSFVLF